MPQKLSLDVPAYPRGGPPLKRGQTVSVTLSFVVGVDGSVSDVSVARSSGVPAVDEAVMAAARKARYRPGTKNGAPVPTRMSHAFSFRGA
jgi:protein TonB